jgi:hypothetical protein
VRHLHFLLKAENIRYAIYGGGTSLKLIGSRR